MFRLISAALLALSTACAAATPISDDTQTWRFKVFLDNRELGQHRFDVRETPDGSDVAISADFEFKLMFITAFRYEHETSESWRGNCLESVRSETVQNRKRFALEADRRDESLAVRAQVGEDARDSALPPCVMSFAYWNPDMLAQDALLNVQTGELIVVDTRFVGRETVELRGDAVDARRFQIRAKDLDIDLWYSNADEWIALESTVTGGRKLRYVLI